MTDAIAIACAVALAAAILIGAAARDYSGGVIKADDPYWLTKR